MVEVGGSETQGHSQPYCEFQVVLGGLRAYHRSVSPGRWAGGEGRLRQGGGRWRGRGQVERGGCRREGAGGEGRGQVEGEGAGANTATQKAFLRKSGENMCAKNPDPLLNSTLG